MKYIAATKTTFNNKGNILLCNDSESHVEEKRFRPVIDWHWSNVVIGLPVCICRSMNAPCESPATVIDRKAVTARVIDSSQTSQLADPSQYSWIELRAQTTSGRHDTSNDCGSTQLLLVPPASTKLTTVKFSFSVFFVSPVYRPDVSMHCNTSCHLDGQDFYAVCNHY